MGHASPKDIMAESHHFDGWRLHMRIGLALGAWPYETELSTHMTPLSEITITDCWFYSCLWDHSYCVPTPAPSLHSGSISVEWLLSTMSYSRWLDGLMIFDTGYSFDIHLLHAGNSVYFIFLLAFISVDIPTLIIDYHYGTVMFPVSWCRFMMIHLPVIGSVLYIVYSFTHWVFYNTHTTSFCMVYRSKL